ncbi:MAG: tetratricopeptide repeat protein [Candidatus Sericytochromatia bacterium]|nr:tetratricopeptide repeat protein [Candidatus Tanganyikabacteria bacterium]
MGLKIAKVTDARTSAEFKLQAHRAYNAGDLEKAAQALYSALELNEQDPEAYLQIATIFAQLGQHDKAILAGKRAIELAPFNGDAYNVLGVALFAVGWAKTGELAFKKAQEFSPEHATARENQLECIRMVREGRDLPEPAEVESIRKLLDTRLPTVSLCMIVKNEEIFLEECLQSVQGAVDEICIVDTGSTDSTVEIARKFGAKIGYHEWNGDFATARNKSIELATCDWILVLDADETITPESINEIRRVSRDKTKVGYACIIENLLGSRPGEGKQMAMIFRFFQNRPDMRYEGIIHEQMLPSAQRTGLPNEASAIRIIHKGYLKKHVEDRNKNERNLRILLEQEKQEPENPYCHFNLGQTYKMLGRAPEAERHYRRSLELLRPLPDANTIPYFASLYFSYTDLIRETGRFEDALELADEGLKRFPQYADLHFTRGNVYLGMERYEEAIKIYEGCRKYAGQVFAGGTDPGVSTYKATNAVGVCYAKLGRLALAKQYLKRALKEWPTPNSEIHTNLGIIYLQEEDTSKAMSHFTSALEIDPKNFQAWLNLGSVCFKQNNLQEAIAAWMQAAAINASQVDLHYLIGEANLRLGRVKAARQAFDIELANNPGQSSAELAIGVCEVLEGNYTAGRTQLEGFAGRYPDSPRHAEFAAAAIFARLAGGEKVDPAEVAATTFKPEQIAAQWQGLLDLALIAARYDDCEAVVNNSSHLTEIVPTLDEAFGRVFLKWEAYDLALDRFLRQQARTPENADLYYVLGETCLGLGNFDDAVVMYQTTLEINPQHHQARGRLKKIQPKSA